MTKEEFEKLILDRRGSGVPVAIDTLKMEQWGRRAGA